jgi:hypothetical protein
MGMRRPLNVSDYQTCLPLFAICVFHFAPSLPNLRHLQPLLAPVQAWAELGTLPTASGNGDARF